MCADLESESTRAGAAGIRAVNLRFGLILSRSGGEMSMMLPPFRLGPGGPLGNGRQYMSWITLDDTIGVIDFALQRVQPARLLAAGFAFRQPELEPALRSLLG